VTRELRLGTRGSRLARIQSEAVAARLLSRGWLVRLVEVVTAGDVRPPGTPFGEGVFVTAIEQALAAGEIDLGVHSAKDVPLEQDPRLVVAAYPERADPRDAVVSRSAKPLDGLASGSVVGTDSPRRAGFVLHRRSDLRHAPFFGNVDTRLRKLDQGEADALVLACSGLDRLAEASRVAERLDPRHVTPAPGQGALAVQCRADDGEVREALAVIDDAGIRLAVEAERAVLEATGGTCRAPVGALGALSGSRLHLLAAAVSPDGADFELVEVECAAEPGSANEAGRAAGRRLKEKVRLPV
jgi:hydroxymethylbilane synthase